MAMRIDQFTFGSIRIDGVIYEHDVVIARGRVRKRKKKSSKPFRGAFGHTPLSIEENIPWDCRRLVVGTGADGALPGDGPGQARGRSSRGAVADCPDCSGHPGAAGRAEGDERDLARDLLIHHARKGCLRERTSGVHTADPSADSLLGKWASSRSGVVATRRKAIVVESASTKPRRPSLPGAGSAASSRPRIFSRESRTRLSLRSRSRSYLVDVEDYLHGEGIESPGGSRGGARERRGKHRTSTERPPGSSPRPGPTTRYACISKRSGRSPSSRPPRRSIWPCGSKAASSLLSCAPRSS